MVYGGVGESEGEVIVRLDRHDGQAHINSTWPAWSRRLERLYGSPTKVTERDGKATSAFWAVPLDRVSLRRARMPRPARQLTPAQQAAQDRFRTAARARQKPI